ncbi:PKD domain-containing protein [Geminicoccus harenae]|uniref:PKD domain-containing protein n=3 Tax=Geminicoccus harenae TaxID=2498453 RepID=UPI001C986D99|nr:PKD domain-containing protein [Geminicoccus harenae]
MKQAARWPKLRPWPLALCLVPFCFPGGLAGPAAAAEPLSVVYGPGARTAEGDQDYREVIHLSVPDSVTGPLFLRVHDADAGGAHDTRYGSGWDTQVRYRIYGGKGAAGPAASPGDEAGAAGTLLGEAILGEDVAADGAWRTLARFAADAGDHVDGRYVFRLEVTGLAGDDGNGFLATLSLRDRRDVPPEGLLAEDQAPTVRIPDQQRATELVFAVPDDAERLTIGNFDAAAGRIAFTSTYRTVELTPSGQDEWQSDTVELLTEERGGLAALVLSGGQEMPNDLTLSVQDEDGRVLPLRLPVRAALPNGRPLPAVDHAPLADCSAIAFDAGRSSDPDGGRLDFAWAFGDGTEAEGEAVVHRYPGPGIYRGVLRVRDGSDQVGNGAALPFEVTVKRPPTADAGADMVVAPGTEVRFDGQASEPGDRPIASYGWDFQDGTQADGPTPSHVFERSGTHVVTLTVSDDQPGACDSSTDQMVVQVNAPPVAVPGPGRHVAAGEPVRLDGSRSFDVDGEVQDWTWDLGDGTQASGPVVEHEYAEPGSYTVMLAVTDAAGLANSRTSATTQVLVNDPPMAVAGESRSAALGEVLIFDGSDSTDRDGRLVRHEWDFGGGGRGQGQVVRYAYDRPGTYEVTLTVTDDSASATSQASDRLIVTVNAPPVAEAGPDQRVTASEVRFDGSGSVDPDGRIVRYLWAFGDGATGAGPAPAHVYQAPGRYLVRLTVTDDSGTLRSSAGDTLEVTVNQAPIADAGQDLLGAPGQELRFSGAGSIDPDGDISAYLWDFKDGSTASGEEVTHRFAKAGVYDVQLTVQDDTGQPDAVDFDKAKVVINARPIAKAGPDVLAAPGDPVVLDGGNSFDPDGRIEGYRWAFSDAPEPAVEPKVTRSYGEPGVYGARLTVTDGSGAANGSDQDELVIRINHQPVAHAGQDQFASDNTVRFDASLSADADGDALVYLWDFGDGSPPMGGAQVAHTYAEGGVYPVLLTVDDGTGLSNARAVAGITVTIDRPPVADAGGNREACAGDIMVFDASRSQDPEGGVLRYRWDFGDGSGADIVNPTKTYLTGATYPVTLTVSDDSGFAANHHTDRVLVRVTESPIADAGPDQLACAGSEVMFDGSRSRDADGVVNRFTWDFGDGSTGGGERPVHVFGKPGEYRVMLTIDGDDLGQCASTNTDEMKVRVVDAPAARIAAPDQMGAGAAVRFDASASTTAVGRITGWQWAFGDGETATGPVVEHRYAKAGSYVARLTLETEGGIQACSTITASHPITVNAPPVADAGPDRTAAVAEEILFDAGGSHDPDGGIVAYQWDFGDGTTASGINARHSFRKGGRHLVTLTVTDDLGLPNSQATDTAEVVVNHAPEPVIAAPAAACPGEPLSFGGGGSKDGDGQLGQFAWSFGDGATAAGSDVTHRFAAPGLYEVTLAVDDGSGMKNAQAQAVLPFRVNRQPRAIAGPDRLVCPDEDVRFDGRGSVDWDGQLVRHHWDFGDGSTAEGAEVSHRFAEPGLYDVRLTVTDDSGSRCAAATSVARVRVNATPVLAITGERSGFVGGAHDRLLLDASGSSHPDGTPLTFRWELGDGSVLAGDKVRHRFAEPGVYPVRLTASDGTGLACGQATEQVEVRVQARP